MTILKSRFLGILSAALFLLVSLPTASWAEDFGTKEQAKSMVEHAAAFYKANGKEKALAEFSNPKGQFIDRDLYLVTYAPDGIRLSHPYNAKLIGKSALDAVDFDGKPYGQEIIQTANTKGSGWVDYKFTDPTTKKLSDKTLYVLKVDDIIIGCGVYRH
jgi:signal transduction histidine kinase